MVYVSVFSACVLDKDRSSSPVSLVASEVAAAVVDVTMLLSQLVGGFSLHLSHDETFFFFSSQHKSVSSHFFIVNVTQNED